MKKKDILNVDGYVGGISRKAIINELLQNRYVFPSKFSIFLNKAKLVLFVIFLIVLAFLSGYAIGDYLAFDKGYEAAIRSIYSGSASDVENNKKREFKRILGRDYEKQYKR